MRLRRFELLSLALGMVLLQGARQEVLAGAPGTEKQETRTPDALKVLQDKSAPARERASMAVLLGSTATGSEVLEFSADSVLLASAVDKHEDFFVRQECIRALGRLESRAPGTKDRCMESFIEALKDRQENAQVRKRIEEYFRDAQSRKVLADDKAFALLVRIAEDKKENPLVRIGAVDAVGSFNEERSIAVLAELLGQTPPPTEPLKSAVVRSFSRLLTNMQSTQAFGVVTINRIAEFATDRKYPPDLRGNALRTLARLKAKNVRGVDKLVDDIKKILESETEMKLLLAAVESLGILGDESGLEALQNALRAYAQDENADALIQANRTLIRRTAMDTLGEVLSRQNQKPNAAAIFKCTDMLLEAIKVGTTPNDKMEADEVQKAAIFSLQYLCPNKKEFQAQHRRAVEALVTRMKPAHKPDEEMLNAIAKTLEAITEQPFETDIRAWEEYLAKGN